MASWQRPPGGLPPLAQANMRTAAPPPLPRCQPPAPCPPAARIECRGSAPRRVPPPHRAPLPPAPAARGTRPPGSVEGVGVRALVSGAKTGEGKEEGARARAWDGLGWHGRAHGAKVARMGKAGPSSMPPTAAAQRPSRTPHRPTLVLADLCLSCRQTARTTAGMSARSRPGVVASERRAARPTWRSRST
jgi:hypothetical protein